MNSRIIPMPGRPAQLPLPARRRFRWRHLFLGVFGLGVLGVLVLVLSFLPGGEVRALRQIALASAPGRWERKVEFGIGRIPAWIARTGLSFAPLDPGPRAAVNAFRYADVALFERPGQAGAKKSTSEEKANVAGRVRAEMERRGWEVVVQVQERDEVVGVFMPRKEDGGSSVRVCVFVLDGSNMVIVSGRADLAPVIDYALSRDGGVLFARR